MRKRKRIKTSKLFTFIICVCGALSIHFSTARSILLAAVFLKHFSFMILRLWFYDEWIYLCVWNDDLCHWFRMTSPPSSSPPAPLISFFYLAAKNSEERRTMHERPKVPMLNADFSNSEQRTHHATFFLRAPVLLCAVEMIRRTIHSVCVWN